MSTYLDVRTGRWFNSKAELLAFQRGEDQTSPRSVSTPKESKSEPPKPEPEKKIEPEVVEDTTTEEVVEETKNVIDDEFEAMIKEAMLMTVDAIKDELRDHFGVDGRTLRFASEDTLKQMYLDRVKAAWKVRQR